MTTEAIQDPPMTVVAHLTELRFRIIISLVILFAGTAAAYHWSGEFMRALASPVGGLIFTAPTEAFTTRLKISFFAGFMGTLPLLLYQLWSFIAPAIDRPVRKILWRMLPVSYILFLAGASLAFFVVVPAALRFLLSFGTEEITPLLTLGAYLGFVTGLCLAFGSAFQMPLVLYILNKAGIVSREALVEKRRYVYFLTVVAAALMTPGPDFFSQIALAVPSVVLFELTLLVLE